ncbi:MAG: peptidyl-prolyl cis-trans isomerase [Solirubrobacteraceae bacterium]
MKSLRTILALGAFFVLAVAVAGCGGSSGGGIPSGSVATVAGNPISTRAVNHWMYVAAKGAAASAPGQPVIVPNDPPDFAHCIKQARAEVPSLKKTSEASIRKDCDGLFKSLSGQVMDFLIKAYWYQADAHKLGVHVTDAQVTKALDAAKKKQFKTDAAYQAFLKDSGETNADLLFQFRVRQLFAKLTARHNKSVTQAAIASYYNSHKSQFGTPETRNMRIVLTKTAAKAQQAKAALQHGGSWNTVAKQYSTDATTRKNGGLLTNVTAGQQDAALSKAAFAAPVNKLLGPVKGQYGYYVLEVTKITPATQKTLAQSTTQIKQTLNQQYASAAQAAVDSHAKKDWLHRTSCRDLYAMADCKGYKAPSSSSSSATGAATAAPPSSATTPPPASSSSSSPSASSSASSTTTSSSSHRTRGRAGPRGVADPA